MQRARKSPETTTKSRDGHTDNPSAVDALAVMRVWRPSNLSWGNSSYFLTLGVSVPLPAAVWAAHYRSCFANNRGGYTQSNPRNMAYTNERLRLHMDLVYYESPPGLQASLLSVGWSGKIVSCDEQARSPESGLHTCLFFYTHCSSKLCS